MIESIVGACVGIAIIVGVVRLVATRIHVLPVLNPEGRCRACGHRQIPDIEEQLVSAVYVSITGGSHSYEQALGAPLGSPAAAILRKARKIAGSIAEEGHRP